MKLKTIIDAMPGIRVVYDRGVTDFQRKWSIRNAYKELKEAVEMFEAQHEKILADYSSDGTVPRERFYEYTQRLKELREKDVELKHVLKFKMKEVEDSRVEGSLMVAMMDDFILIEKEGKN